MKVQSFSLMLLSKFPAVGQCSGLGLCFGSCGGGGSSSMLTAGVMGREEGTAWVKASLICCQQQSAVGERDSGDLTAPCRRHEHHGHLGSCIIKFSYIP